MSSDRFCVYVESNGTATTSRSAPAADQCAPLLADVNARRGRMCVDPRTAGFGIDAGSAAAHSPHLSPAAGRDG
jgi:hypothetical protein